MRTVIVVAAVTALMLGELMAITTPRRADEPLKILAGGRVVDLEGTRLQIIPTNRGALMIPGDLRTGKEMNALFFEGAQPAKLQVKPHTQTEESLLHREPEQELADTVRPLAQVPKGV